MWTSSATEWIPQYGTTSPPDWGQDVLFVGRLEYGHKGLDLLLEAWAHACERVEGNLLIAGTGPDEERLRTSIQEAGVSERVQMLGWLSGGERKFRALTDARLLVVPSRHETFGLVAIDALAAGTPVIAFDIPCLKEIIPTGTGVDRRCLRCRGLRRRNCPSLLPGGAGAGGCGRTEVRCRIQLGCARRFAGGGLPHCSHRTEEPSKPVAPKPSTLKGLECRSHHESKFPWRVTPPGCSCHHILMMQSCHAARLLKPKPKGGRSSWPLSSLSPHRRRIHGQQAPSCANAPCSMQGNCSRPGRRRTGPCCRTWEFNRSILVKWTRCFDAGASRRFWEAAHGKGCSRS